ncbi:DUF2264 domain-containing protein [Enterococcus sp. LJL128]
MMKQWDNDFLTREDYAQAMEKLIQPIREEIIHSDFPGVHLGSSGAVYNQQRADMEALIRPLWGLAPYWTLKKDDQLRDAYLNKLAAGTDSANAAYWGDVENYDQYIVEMAALSLTLLLHREYFWEQLPLKQQQTLIQWMAQALDRQIPKNNWMFFKVLIRIALYQCGEALNHEALEKELLLTDGMYVGEGWYVDGKETQRDYYIPFAFHYYGLIYVKFMGAEDPERSQIFIERATRFAQDFLHYFDADGEALPYGRSLTYRFAQAAFFSALVFADVEAVPWGVMKGIMSKHMKKWMDHDIFTFDGRLSIGYHYENLVMAEGYNAPGSPYWAFKTFLLLAVEETHPFWQAQPIYLKRNEKRLVKEGRLLLLHESNGAHVLGFPAGMLVEGQAHGEAKYSKFVYSTKFGFSVPKAGIRYEEGAFDNTLAISVDGNCFRVKRETESYQLSEEKVVHQWSPFKGVNIRTEIYPFGEWHVRFHEIETARPLEVREGGFSVGFEGRKPHTTGSKETASVQQGPLTSKIINIEDFEEAYIVQPEPNTSLFFPRTSFPYLKKQLPSGRHRLISLVGGLYTKEERE